MGLRYRFEMVVPSPGVDELLLALAHRLCRRDMERLFAALPWQPNEDLQLVWGSGPPERLRTGIDGMHDHLGICVSMRFEPDETLEAYDSANFPLEREDGALLIGCVYLSLDVGEQFAVLRAQTATSAMSRAFAASQSVRQTFVELAQTVGAEALFFDTEKRTWVCLHPVEGVFPRPQIDSYVSADFSYLRIDRYSVDVIDLLLPLDVE